MQTMTARVGTTLLVAAIALLMQADSPPWKKHGSR